MDFFSDTTKKERRSLLVAGSIGILVPWLTIDQAEMELVGLKIHQPNLPLMIVVSLCVAITYLLVKFWFSYVHDQSSAMKAAHETLLNERNSPLDIEEGIAEEERGLTERRKVIRLQEENERRQIADHQEEVKAKDLSYEASLKITDKEIGAKEQVLAKNAEQYVRYPDGTLVDRDQVENNLKRLKDDRLDFVRNMGVKRQQDIDSLDHEKNRWNELQKALAKELQNSEAGLNERRKHLLLLRQAEKILRRISPLQRSLEIYLPLLVGGVSICSLIYKVYVMHYFPSLPKLPMFPEF